MDMMARMSWAQSTYLEDLLCIDGCFDQIDSDLNDLSHRLSNCEVDTLREEHQALFQSLKIRGNGDMKRLNRLDKFANAHLFQLRPSIFNIENTLAQIAMRLQVSEFELMEFQKFAENLEEIVEHAVSKDCVLYFEAEQSIFHPFIESVTQ